jgi:acyl carrier protein
MSTFGDVKDIIIKQLKINETHVTADASFLYDLGTDSVDSVSLIMALECEFNIEIHDEINNGLNTVQDVVNYIDSCRQGAPV